MLLHHFNVEQLHHHVPVSTIGGSKSLNTQTLYARDMLYTVVSFHFALMNFSAEVVNYIFKAFGNCVIYIEQLKNYCLV